MTQLQFAFHDYDSILDVPDADIEKLREYFAMAGHPNSTQHDKFIYAVAASRHLLNVYTSAAKRKDLYQPVVRKQIYFAFKRCGLEFIGGGCHSQVFNYTPHQVIRVFHGSDGWLDWAKFCLVHYKELSPAAQRFLPDIDTMYNLWDNQTVSMKAAIIGRCIPMSAHGITLDPDVGHPKAAAIWKVFYGDLHKLNPVVNEPEFLNSVAAVKEILEHPECPRMTDVHQTNCMLDSYTGHPVLTDPVSWSSDSLSWFEENGLIKEAA